MSEKQIVIHLNQAQDYRFQIEFGDSVPALTVDEPQPLRCKARADVDCNAEGKIRVLGIKGVLTLGVLVGQLQHLDQALDQLEAFYTVTQGVRLGIPVSVEVQDASEVRLK
jgi:hypothetical protein